MDVVTKKYTSREMKEATIEAYNQGYLHGLGKRPVAHWDVRETSPVDTWYVCSACDYYSDIGSHPYSYCPCCGAHMSGGN